MGFNEVSSLYELGSIVELKVEKKLLEPQLVIFNLDGVSARLHISKISNSPDLSLKLFNVITVGEPIISVIIGFNTEKKHVELISNNKRFNVKKLNLCIGNISLIRILKNSDLIHDTDIISYEDSAIKYGLNLKLNHKKYYYIPMSIKQIIEKVLYRSLYYNDNDNNRNLFIQAVSNKKKIFRFSVEQLLSSKKSFYRGLTTNHIANLRINNISIENYLLKKSKRIIVNCTGTIPYYVPGSISQELIYNTFIKS